MSGIRLTQFSHGAGCGCKLSPSVLSEIIKEDDLKKIAFPNLLVGNEKSDDAAVYDLGDGKVVISTTDFFMPIVDDPYTFGMIAGANAISDIYAMGGKPLMAIAILGWPIDKIPIEHARAVVSGGRAICGQAGIPLAGGHSIDSPEPIFGLAVTGIVDKKCIKTNSGAKEGDLLFLTKSLGVGILTTAEKKGLLLPEDKSAAADSMLLLNKIGEVLGQKSWVNAITDVTGFGLLGHLLEMCEGSNLSAELDFEKISHLGHNGLWNYIDQGCIPGGTNRNLKSYGEKIDSNSEKLLPILADPQTSGGLLVAISPEHLNDIQTIFKENNLDKYVNPIGTMINSQGVSRIKINRP